MTRRAVRIIRYQHALGDQTLQECDAVHPGNGDQSSVRESSIASPRRGWRRSCMLVLRLCSRRKEAAAV